jgi:hypothetical protein
MKHSITRDEVAWLVLRTIGLLFAWFSLTKIAGFAYTAYILTSDSPINIQAALVGRFSLELALPQVFMVLICGVLAYYFLRHGGFCHRLLCFGARIPRIPHTPLNSRWDENE